MRNPVAKLHTTATAFCDMLGRRARKMAVTTGFPASIWLRVRCSSFSQFRNSLLCAETVPRARKAEPGRHVIRSGLLVSSDESLPDVTRACARARSHQRHESMQNSVPFTSPYSVPVLRCHLKHVYKHCRAVIL